MGLWEIPHWQSSMLVAHGGAENQLQKNQERGVKEMGSHHAGHEAFNRLGGLGFLPPTAGKQGNASEHYQEDLRECAV